MATLNISLPDQMKAWVEAQANEGRYASASDYLRDLVRKDQDRLNAIAEIRALIDEGTASGVAEPIDRTAFFEEMRRKTDGRSSKA